MTILTLHPRQRAILEFVAAEIDGAGLPPSIRQIGASLEIWSTSVVNYHLNKLRDRGLIVRDVRVSRGLAMTDAGYRALGRRPRVADAALGRALRRAARRDPRAAGVLAELEVA